ncbi:MAG TPA: S53 family peptidase [Solirubrobacteraceae bacterium]|nr:S53 family peptidase [Solirubrobacteraceae bacterium]
MLAAVGALAAAPAMALGASGEPAPVSPLPSSDYETRPVCAAPPPGHVSCMADLLVGRSAAARAHTHPIGLAAVRRPDASLPATGFFGLRPADLHTAYSLPTTASTAQTIAIVDAYNDPTAEADLRTYDEEFSLPACTTENGCFKQVNQKGNTSPLPFPKSSAELEEALKGTQAQVEEAEEAEGWGLEISLDIETARAVCQSCHILLVEGNAALTSDLDIAEEAAETLGANEISNSWGGSEEGQTAQGEAAGPFNHPGTVITASAGDAGYLDWDSSFPGAVEFPAASPHVVAVGGTRLEITKEAKYLQETVWNGDGAGGGGCSTTFTAPSWQRSLSDWASVGCSLNTRAVSDVSADADPYTGVAVTDSSTSHCVYTEPKTPKHTYHWCTLGGTSLASPLVASVFALAGGSGGVSYPADSLYADALATPEGLHDVKTGSNGACANEFTSEGLSGCTTEEEGASCSHHLICVAAKGYDGPTGLGTPNGITDFLAPAGGGKEEGSGGSGGSEGGGGSGGSSGGGSSPPAGGQPPQGAIGAETAAPGPGSDEEAEEEGQGSGAEGGIISGLVLAPATLAAAARRHLTQLAFSFTASASVHVRVTLARRVTSRRHVRWHTLHRSLTIAAKRGRNSGRLTTGTLPPGTYRLTLTAHGTTRSLLVRIRP